MQFEIMDLQYNKFRKFKIKPTAPDETFGLVVFRKWFLYKQDHKQDF